MDPAGGGFVGRRICPWLRGPAVVKCKGQERRLEKRTCLSILLATNSPFTSTATPGQEIRLPIAHGEGCYVADERTLDELEAEDRVALRYIDNANGSMRQIAGILNRERNVMGMMPHPERRTEALMGSTDGLFVFQSMLEFQLTPQAAVPA